MAVRKKQSNRTWKPVLEDGVTQIQTSFDTELLKGLHTLHLLCMSNYCGINLSTNAWHHCAIFSPCMTRWPHCTAGCLTDPESDFHSVRNVQNVCREHVSFSAKQSRHFRETSTDKQLGRSEGEFDLWRGWHEYLRCAGNWLKMQTEPSCYSSLGNGYK